MSKEKMVVITAREYNSLRYDQDFLNGLYGAGVDNWGGYDEFDKPDEEYDYSQEVMSDNEDDIEDKLMSPDVQIAINEKLDKLLDSLKILTEKDGGCKCQK